MQEQIAIKLAWGVAIAHRYDCGFTAMLNAKGHDTYSAAAQRSHNQHGAN